MGFAKESILRVLGDIKVFDDPRMWGLGTPEDLQIFLNNSNE